MPSLRSSTAAGTRPASAELIPLAERLLYLRLFRVGLVVLVGIFGALTPDAITVRTSWLVLVSAGYVAATLALEGVWRLVRQRNLRLFGILLIFDGLYLSWASYATGGSLSPVRYLLLLHLITVVLLASYRTGLKLALWDSLLLFVIYQSQASGVLTPLRGAVLGPRSTEYRRLLEFVIVFWLVSLATAAFSAINERELRRRRYDLEALARMGAALEEAADAGAVADVVIDSIADTFGFSRMLLLGRHSDELSLIGHLGVEPDVISRYPAHHGSVIETVSRERRTLLVSQVDPAKDGWLLQLLPDARNLVVTTLTAEGRTIGVLVAEHAMRTGSRIERRVVSTIERFVSHAALALRNAYLLEQVQRVAATDGLTGIANRRSFDAFLDRELARAERNGDQLSLLLFDIDHFKALNDTHGHQAGDEVLRQVATTIAGGCREYDIAARYGGEEFAVILPNCSSKEAMSIAERLRQSVAATDGAVPVTASAGVSTYPANADDVVTLVQAADRALYESKHRGRNRVTKSKAAARRRPSSVEAAS